MKTGLLLVTALVAILPHLKTDAGYKTGNQLLNECAREEMQCFGYLQAVADTGNTFGQWKLLDTRLFCIPGGVTTGQLEQAFVNYANRNLEQLKSGASSLVINAYHEEFACN